METPIAVTLLLFLQANALEFKAYEFTYCPEIPDKRAFLVTIRPMIRNDQQQFIGNVTMLKEFNNDNTLMLVIYRVLGNREIRLLNYKGKHACNALKTYGGEKFQTVAKMAEVPNPTICPIAKGNYGLSEYITIRVSDIPKELRGLAPKGKFRIKFYLNDTKTGNVDYCNQFFVDKY